MSIKPKFFSCDGIFKDIWNKHGVYFSTKFCNYFANNVEKIMQNECNLKASTKISLSLFKQENEKPMYEVGSISKLNIAISILPYFTDDLEFCWKSKDGTIIKTSDEDFDEDNLISWINGLKPKLYWEEAFSKKIEHPFLLKNLGYDLQVYDYGTHMSIKIELKEMSNLKTIVNSVINLIELHNENSLKKDRKSGVIHNSSYEVEDNIIDYRIDLGSAGIGFLKKILKQLSKFSNIKKVIFDL